MRKHINTKVAALFLALCTLFGVGLVVAPTASASTAVIAVVRTSHCGNITLTANMLTRTGTYNWDFAGTGIGMTHTSACPSGTRMKFLFVTSNVDNAYPGTTYYTAVPYNYTARFFVQEITGSTVYGVTSVDVRSLLWT